MKHWTTKRKASFYVHGAFAFATLALSVACAALFWHWLFNSWLFAVLMIFFVEVVALTGLVLYILGIESPFATLRHALPYISVVPLGLELWRWLEPHGAWISIPTAVLVTAVVVTLAARCYQTIEALFVDGEKIEMERIEEEAAQTRRRMRRQVEALATTLDALNDMRDMVAVSLDEWSRQHSVVVTSVDKAMPLLSASADTAPTSITVEQKRRYAALIDRTVRTVERDIASGKLSARDIIMALANKETTQ